MKHTVRHPLPPERAKQMLDRLLETYREHYKDYAMQSVWTDEETAEVDLCISGRDIKGEIRVCADCYEVDMKLPLFFRPFQSKIRRGMDEEVERWLEQWT